MALDVEGVVEGGVNGQEALADPGDLKRCIFCSRRRVGRCEFSARLFCVPWQGASFSRWKSGPANSRSSRKRSERIRRRRMI